MLALRHLLSFRRFRRILLISSPSPTFKPSYSQTFQYSVRTGPVEASLFRLPNLATRHSSLASIPFRIRTYEKSTRNPFRIRTSKTQHLKSFRIRTYEETREGVGSVGQPILVVLRQFCEQRNSGHMTRNTDLGARVTSHKSRYTAIDSDAAFGRTRFQRHPNPVPRAQCDRGQRNYRMSFHQPEPVLLRNGRKCQRHFHQRERSADALARSSSKRKISEPWNPFQQVALPPFGTKFFRCVVPSRVAVHRPLRKRDAGPFWHRVARNFEVFNGCARRSPRGRIKPHRFGDDVIRINELRQIVKRRSAPCKHRPQLTVELRFDSRILREQPPRPGQRIRGGLMSGQEQRDGFVAKLFVGHARAVFILRGQQHGKQVARIAARGAFLRDHSVEHFFNLPDSSFQSEIRRCWQPLRNKKCAPEIGAEFQQKLQRFADVLCVSLHVRIEQRFGDDLQREPHHLLVNVALFAVLPLVEQPLGVLHHRRRVARDSRAVKRGLDQAPLTEPEISLARQQASSENALIRLQHAAFYEFSWMIYQHVFDVIRMVDQQDAEIKNAKPDDISILADNSREISKWIAAVERAQRPAPQPEGRTRRKFELSFGVHHLMLRATLGRVNEPSFKTCRRRAAATRANEMPRHENPRRHSKIRRQRASREPSMARLAQTCSECARYDAASHLVCQWQETRLRAAAREMLPRMRFLAPPGISNGAT